MVTKKATLNINPEIHRQLKIRAAELGMKLNELAENVLLAGLKNMK